jgi:hypothetical protein
MASWLHLTLGLGLLMGRDDDWLRSPSTCLLLLVQKMARSLSLYSACIPWGLLRRVLVTGAAPFLLDSRGVRSRQCDDFPGSSIPCGLPLQLSPGCWQRVVLLSQVMRRRGPRPTGSFRAWVFCVTMIGSRRRFVSLCG